MANYKVIVSHTGTRHIVGKPPGFQGIQAHAFRVTCICGFGIREGEALPLDRATRDCPFCLAESAVIEQRERQEAGRAA